MAIGFNPQRRGLFGQMVPPASQPPLGTPPFNPNAMPAPEMAPDAWTPAQPQQRGLFAGFNRPGGTAERLYALGGLLQGDPNAVGNYHAMQQQRALLAQQPQIDAAKREQDFADWARREDYKWANAPESDPELVRVMRAAGIDPASEQGRGMLRQRAENIANPPEWRIGPDGRFYRVETAEPQVLGQTLPQGWTIEGGSGGNAAGNFP